MGVILCPCLLSIGIHTTKCVTNDSIVWAFHKFRPNLRVRTVYPHKFAKTIHVKWYSFTLIEEMCLFVIPICIQFLDHAQFRMPMTLQQLVHLQAFQPFQHLREALFPNNYINPNLRDISPVGYEWVVPLDSILVNELQLRTLSRRCVPIPLGDLLSFFLLRNGLALPTFLGRGSGGGWLPHTIFFIEPARAIETSKRINLHVRNDQEIRRMSKWKSAMTPHVERRPYEKYSHWLHSIPKNIIQQRPWVLKTSPCQSSICYISHNVHIKSFKYSITGLVGFNHEKFGPLILRTNMIH